MEDIGIQVLDVVEITHILQDGEYLEEASKEINSLNK